MNDDILDRIYSDYYLAGRGAEQMSSHWSHYSRLFSVEKRRDGAIALNEGVGFGDMMIRNPVLKTFATLCNLSYWVRLDRRREIAALIPAGLRVARRMGAFFSFDCFRQVCALDLILKNRPGLGEGDVRIAIIGDGYGFLASLIRELLPNARLLLIDLGKTLLFQAETCRRVHPKSRRALVGDAGAESADFVFCPADRTGDVNFNVDVAINIASMQEMTPEAVAGYFSFLRSRLNPDNLFYCCNRELKVLFGGEKLEIRNYPWLPSDRHLVDDECPWYSYFFSYKTAPNGPRILGLRVPFVNYFDGRMIHRLSVLSPVAEPSRVAAGR